MSNQLNECVNDIELIGSLESLRSVSVNSPRQYRRGFRIGGVSLELLGASLYDVRGGIEMEKFESDEQSSDISINIRWQETLGQRVSQQAFDSGATWRLYRNGGNFVLDFSSAALALNPYKRMLVDESFSRAEIVLSRSALNAFPEILPVEYPICELLITNYLAYRGLGVEVHGCGLIDRETGAHLFLGHSGAGKSTTAHLWEKARNPEILSDDRLILRLHDGELWMYGTPWHGEAAFALPGRAKLQRIHILQHGSENRLIQIHKGRAVGELFARTFPPFHSRAGLERTIDFLERLVEVVPCFEFHFMPYQSAIAAILDFDRLN
ncbi:MAG TPA: hypothetical protein VJ731_09750 [Terriglobales bacterium]|nr:hypothetical protein [Terriglobales bacterium]